MKNRFTILIAALMLLTMINLPGKVAGQSKTLTTLFEETFADCTGTMGWSGSVASGEFNADNDGWTVDWAYGANGAARFGKSKSGQGSAETPSISFTGNATLTFKAGAWSGDNTNLKLSATGGTLKIDGTVISSVTLVNGEWTTYTVDITNVSSSVKIKFLGNGSSSSRFFLDDVKITQDISTDPTLSVSPAIATTFKYSYGSSTTPSQAFTASGSNLTASITVSVSSTDNIFEISSDNNTFGTSNLTLSNGDRFYVHLKTGLEIGDTYSGTVTLSSTGADDKELLLSGSVTETVDTYLTSDDMAAMTGSLGYGNTKTVITDDGFLWTTTGYQGYESRIGMIQLRTSGTPYILLPTFNGKIKEISFTVTTTGTDTYVEGSYKTTTALQFRASSDGDNIASGGGTSTNHITIDLSSKFYTTGYIVSDGGIRVWDIKVTYLPYNNFTDLDPLEPMPTLVAGDNYAVPSDMSTINLTIPATAALVVKSGATLTVTGTLTNSGTASNLVVEDGGQLITISSVAATFKKTMSTPTKDVHGWELISSPVHDDASSVIDVTHVTNLTTSPYDMFAYDEATHKWLNQKANAEPYSAGFSELNVGEGYMYRNNAKELSFVGNTNSGDVTRTLSYTAGDLAGFHLVGNPYTHDITIEDNVTLLDNNDVAIGEQLSGYYLLTNGGSEWSAKLDADEEISNKQGFLIQIPAEAKKINFEEAAAKKNRANAYNIMFAVSNSQFNDVTYALFDKALPLNKIDHRNPEVPMIYINQDGKDYAIATMSDDTKSFNLNFKAGTIGKYTLIYKAEGDFDYIHVIDRLTGEDVDMLLEGEFSFIAAPGDNENRFIVRLGYMPNNEGTENEIFAYQNGNDVIVNGEGELQVFDVTGRMVATQRVNGVETINMLSHGVYIFKLNEKVQKIVVR